jgi:hypothetical protein
VCIEQFTGIVCVIARVLKPYWKVGIVEPLLNKLRIASYMPNRSDISRVFVSGIAERYDGHTVWRVHIGNIGIMGLLSGPQRHPRRTAESSGAVVSLVGEPLVGQMLFDIGEIVQRPQVEVLIVCYDEDDIRSRLVGRRQSSV